MRLFVLLLAITGAPLAWGQAAPAGSKPSCRPLLTLQAGEADRPALAVSTCDVDVLVADTGGLAVRLRESAMRSLGEALGPRGRYFPAMLDARLRVEPVTGAPDLAGFPGGLLLASESERLVRDGHWRWSRNDQLLRWTPAMDAAADLAACRAFAGQRVVLWGGALDRQPGEVIAPQPWAPGHAPGFGRPVPKACVGAWSASDGAPVAIDGQTGVMVVQPLRTGASPQSFTLATRVAGAAVQGQVMAYDARRQPLVGPWMLQQSPGCDGFAATVASRFKHIDFMADGHFQARAVPFESRYDAWGQYGFDSASGRFELRVEGGNDTAGLQALAGAATVGNGRFALSQLVFTPAAAAGACSWSLVQSR